MDIILLGLKMCCEWYERLADLIPGNDRKSTSHRNIIGRCVFWHAYRLILAVFGRIMIGRSFFSATPPVWVELLFVVAIAVLYSSTETQSWLSNLLALKFFDCLLRGFRFAAALPVAVDALVLPIFSSTPWTLHFSEEYKFQYLRLPYQLKINNYYRH